MTELAPYVPPGQAEIDYTWNLAAKLSKTEFVPGNLRGKPEAVLAVFLTGRELGIGPMQSLRDIYPVNGRPALMASLMVARVRGLGHRFHTLYSGDDKACVQISRRGEELAEPVVVFTIEDAKRAGLTDKTVWRQYPKAMLWNRAAAAACRRDCPEALGGAVYTPEEIEDGNGTTTATWGAPEPVHQESGEVASYQGRPTSPDPTSGAGERRDVGSHLLSDRHDPAPDPTSDPPASPPPASGGSDQTSPPVGPGEVPGGDAEVVGPVSAESARAGDGTGEVGPTPSLVQQWCDEHKEDIRVMRSVLRRLHGDEFKDLKDWRDLDELRGERAALAIRRLDEWKAIPAEKFEAQGG